MPTYEYRCSNGHVFEKRQKISDRPSTKCPECGAPATRQISGGAGLVFKGSGFYITDYGKDGKDPAKRPTEGAGGEKSEKTPAKPSESKPAAPAKDSSGKSGE
jgi:putative FmdB family regulatory protein